MTFDRQLQAAVLAELGRDPSVTATGRVETFAVQHAAETATSRVRGVKAVAEEIQVELPFERSSDGDIAAVAIERLAIL
jgi:hypothetical protein